MDEYLNVNVIISRDGLGQMSVGLFYIGDGFMDLYISVMEMGFWGFGVLGYFSSQHV